ncbi:MAG: glycoside hydrolase family 9 protein [Cyanobacteria bacterium J06607_6]
MNFTNFVVEDSWGSGFVGYITFKNNKARPLDGWRLAFEAPFKISEIWDGQIVRKRGDRYTVKNVEWNSELAPGESISFGFVADAPPNGKIYSAANRPAKFVLAGNPAPSGGAGNPPAGGSKSNSRFNYGEALQKSFLFYEAQRAGRLPADNRIDWRGDSTLSDGADVGLNLSRGYFDAGDTVKFGMPMAAAMTLLAWGVDEYRDGYRRSGQLDEAMDAIRWGTDYIMRAHVSENGRTKAFYGQVGLGDVDHAYEGRVEDMDVERPAFKIDAQNPGTDLAAESAAALAAASLVFRKTNRRYANRLVSHARRLYAFAYRYRGRYSDSIKDADKFYKSWDGYEDELSWAATWLYKATGNKAYLRRAIANYDGVGWTQSWGDKNWGTSILLAQEQPNVARYRRDSEQWLNNWVDGNGAGGVKYTPGGLAWIVEWGPTRMAATAAFLAGVYSDTVRDPNGKYDRFAESQVDYLLGDNPDNFSYMVGFGDNYAQQPHHRNAAGNIDFDGPLDNQHILYGALIGGPSKPNESAYKDDRADYVANEAALDYNAGMTGALARMYSEFGGDPLSDAQLDALPGISVSDVGL